ncbi:AmmeMemoRadiSam system protein A [Shewanella marisflavi]|uniref:AmmeMemoRadiSam system protein A n=1 Tax=Shewanella marisflavi TaxID=260364 RepID=UPI00200F2D54|nr:AmmeMemoRadiSam system protein A [Shewanella marisflavi]MCL1040465.1 AmmeMemoRadiSam system protein A [Shewanella marisflavi]
MPASSSIELSQADKRELIRMVWQVLDHALAGRGLILPSPPSSEALQRHCACFVTLYHGGELRGCIGTVQTKDPLWRVACENAYASGFNDQRFLPLTLAERAELSLDIAILSPLMPIENQGEQALLDTLRPDIDGLLMDDGRRRALFLPSVWRSLPTPKAFVTALKQKGGWPPNFWHDSIMLQRFTTQVISS